MPDSRERSSVRGSCSGRPSPLFEPPATSSSGSPAASASATMSRNSSRFVGAKRVTSSRHSGESRNPGRAWIPAFAGMTPEEDALYLPLKPRQVGERQFPGMDVQPAQFGAAMQLREDLAGVQQPFGIEGAFEALLMGKIVLVEHRAHQIALLDADPVLASQHPADFDAQPQDVGAEGFGALDLALLVGVVEDERVEVAVAGVKHIGDAEPVPLRKLADASEHLRQPRPRDRPIQDRKS